MPSPVDCRFRDRAIGANSLDADLENGTHAMDESEQLSKLIGDIYDTALEPSLWSNVLENAAAFVGGAAASVYAKDAAKRNIQISYQYGTDPLYVASYIEKYVKFDPSTNCQIFAEVGDIISTEDYMAYDEFLETRFYREWARPQGLVDAATGVLLKTSTEVAMFSVFRHERNGRVNGEARRRINLLMPHVRRAVLVGRLLAAKESEAAELADTFDALRSAVFLVDAKGRIAHTNAAARRLLSKRDPLYASGGRLSVVDTETDNLFEEAFLAADNGDGAIDVKGISLPLVARDGEDYVAHILPLTSGARRRTGAVYAATAAVFAHKAKLPTPSPLEVIARRYKLTPTELRVLLGIVEVGGAPEVAEALGISPTTVRSHLAGLFEKTGVSRQADLVKLLAQFSQPLVD
jgi:DNA-binding CsgD family transcriptional regulator